MVPSEPPIPIGGSQSASRGNLRSNSTILGSQGDSIPPQANFSSLVSPRTHFNMHFPGNAPNISSVLNQSFGNGGLNSGLSSSGGFQCGGIDTVNGPDPLSIAASEIGFASPPSSFAPSNLSYPGSSGQVQNQQILNRSGNQLFSDKQQSQVRQLESQKYQHEQQQLQQLIEQKHQQLQQQLQQLKQQRLQYPSFQGGLGGIGPVKMEPHIFCDQNGPQKQQQNQSLQEQQRQQQRIFHMQQQQQLLNALPQQRPQSQQLFQQQNLPGRSAVRSVYQSGLCARRLTHFLYQQKHRPDDNNIEFWRTFVAEFFDANARKRWCVSLYGNSRQTNGVFPQDVWQCEICNHKPARGFETTVAVLPRLFKIKYDSGILEELLYVDIPHEYQNASGQIVLDYAKATQESVFEQLRVVRDGRLRIVFSPDLKICSWEFCTRHHDELISRRSIVPQVSHLGAAAQKYQATAQKYQDTAQNAVSNSSMQELQSNSNMFLASTRQLAKALEVPLVSDLGYTKSYVRCLQISEVVNSMTELIDYSRESGKGPMDCLAEFPWRTNSLSGPHNSNLQPEQQQVLTRQNLISGKNYAQATPIQLSEGNGVENGNNNHGTTSTITAATSTVGLLRQSYTNSRHENLINNPNSPCAGTQVQIPSTGSSITPPPNQPNPSSPFSSSTPSSSNNLPHSALAASATSNHIDSANSASNIPLQQSSQSTGTDPNESQSSVERIIHEIMNSTQFGGASNTVDVGAVGNGVKNVSRMTHISQNSIDSGSCLVANGVVDNNSGNGDPGNEHSGGGMGLSASVSGNKFATLNGRVGMPLRPQDTSMNNEHSELNNELLTGFGRNKRLQ